MFFPLEKSGDKGQETASLTTMFPGDFGHDTWSSTLGTVRTRELRKKTLYLWKTRRQVAEREIKSHSPIIWVSKPASGAAALAALPEAEPGSKYPY